MLDAVTGFCSSYDLPAAACASPEMLSALSDAISALSGKTYTLDMQMQSALEICRLAGGKAAAVYRESGRNMETKFIKTTQRYIKMSAWEEQLSWTYL